MIIIKQISKCDLVAYLLPFLDHPVSPGSLCGGRGMYLNASLSPNFSSSSENLLDREWKKR
jgi:hypothetical protein